MSTSTINYIQINDSECEEETNHEKLSQKRKEHEENPTKNLILPIKIDQKIHKNEEKKEGQKNVTGFGIIMKNLIQNHYMFK